MMGELEEFLARLRGLDIHLRVEDDKLKFDAPQGAMTPELISQLKKHKSALIAHLSRPTSTAPVIPKIPRSGVLPLSFAQEWFWLNQAANPASCVFNVPKCFAIEGEIDAARLQESVNRIIERHELLRTTYAQTPSGPMQIIHPHTPSRFALALADLSGAPDNEATARRMMLECIQRPIDLQREIPFRLTLFKLGTRHYCLYLCMHHIVLDIGSLQLFLSELGEIYNALTEQREPILPILDIQYADYAAWEKNMRTPQQLAQSLEYWRAYFARQEVPPLHLPFRRNAPTPAANTHLEHYALSGTCMAAFHKLQQDSGATLFAIALSVLFLALYRYTGQTTLVIGAPFIHRQHPALIGPMGKVLLLRLELDPAGSGLDVLRATSRIIFQAISNQSLQVGEAIQLLNIDRRGKPPLFQVMLSYGDQSPQGSLTFSGIRIEAQAVEEVMMFAELGLIMWEEQESLRGWWQYHKQLYSREAIQRFHRDYEIILDALAATPHGCIKDLPWCA